MLLQVLGLWLHLRETILGLGVNCNWAKCTETRLKNIGNVKRCSDGKDDVSLWLYLCIDVANSNVVLATAGCKQLLWLVLDIVVEIMSEEHAYSCIRHDQAIRHDFWRGISAWPLTWQLWNDLWPGYFGMTFVLVIWVPLWSARPILFPKSHVENN